MTGFAGLDPGADDYIRQTLRRDGADLAGSGLCCAACAGPSGQQLSCRYRNLTLSYDQRTVAACDGRPVKLTYKEFELLYFLFIQPGHGAAPATACMQSQSGVTNMKAKRRTVDMHIKTLRQKLEHAGVSGLIQTVRNVGYKITE